MKAIILTLISGAFLMACGPSANFSSDDARFKSLMDGETVEVVENDEFVDSLDQPNAGSQDDDGSNDNMGDGDSTGTTVPTGSTETTTGNDDSMGSDDGSDDGLVEDSPADNSGETARNNTENDNEGKKEEHSCKERLVGQDKENKHDEMLTSPNEMDEDADMYDAIRCGSKDHKVLVCHMPNADYAKRKTLCIGRPALEAHLRHLGAQRGTEHVDYAGPCQDEAGADSEGAEEDGSGDEGDEEKFNDLMDI